jgi:peptidyl-tRNA hydrolase
MPPEAYVLQDFRDNEKPVMEDTYQQVVEAVRVALRDGFELAMNHFNQTIRE